MEDLEKEKKEESLSNFGDNIDSFIKHIEAQTDIVPLVMELLSIKMVQESKQVDEYIKKNGITEKVEDEEDEKGKSKLLIPSDKINGFIELNEKVETTVLAYNLMPVNFVVAFVSQFDAYIGSLIRTMFLIKPELLNSSEKNMLFSDLINFQSIEEAREFIIEKEVESVLRESHLKQFKWLENKLGITLRRDLPSFSDFIEITERRNLFVHCNGSISAQYIEICKENQVKDIESLKVGLKLNATPSYFSKCYSVLFEIGVKLGQVIWRKLKPDDIENADKHLNNICYELLVKGHNKLGLNLLTFATDILKKHHDQEMICILTINKGLAYYLSDKKDECKKVLAKHDWSATSDKFKLAISVLNEDFEKAVEIMKTIGDKSTHITKDAYREWPLFRQFRKTDKFKEVYNEIFGVELVYEERKPCKLEYILEELKQLKKETEETKTTDNKV